MKFYFIKNIRSIALGLILISSVSAQDFTNSSPFSRFSLGEIQDGEVSAFEGMGKSGMASIHGDQFNTVNAASLSYLNTPMFDLGFRLKFANNTNATLQESSNDFYFKNAALGFGIKKKGGVMLGITPYTTTGYQYTENFEDTLLNTTRSHKYTGKGGLNKVFIGGAYRVISRDSIDFSIGFKASYIFGNIERQRRVEFDGGNALNALFDYNYYANGFDFEISTLNRFKISKKMHLQFAMAFNPGLSLNIKKEELIANYLYSSSGIETTFDTINFNASLKTQYQRPMEYKAGITLDFNNQLFWNVDFKYANWSGLNGLSEETEDYRTAYTLATGLEYVPVNNYRLKAPYHKTTAYRLGAWYRQNYIGANGNNLTEWGVGVGFGLPMLRSASQSRINLGAQYGVRGSVDKHLVQEQFINVYIGLTLAPNWRDRWFAKRKYD